MNEQIYLPILLKNIFHEILGKGGDDQFKCQMNSLELTELKLK